MSTPTAEDLNRPTRRLTKLQRALLAHIAELGGRHVYLSRSTRASGHLRGYTWEGVHLSLQSLQRAGLIQKSGKNDGFWTLTSMGRDAHPEDLGESLVPGDGRCDPRTVQPLEPRHER